MSNSLHHYHWLASADGNQQLNRAKELRLSGVNDLKLGELLRASLKPEQAALVLTQLDLRERAASKFTRAQDMLFTRSGLEQSTSEPIATYRSSRYEDWPEVVDLCCGIGGDLTALAGLNVPLTAVDRDPVHLFLAEYNSCVYQANLDLTPLLMNVEDFSPPSRSAVFIDPARRQESGRRTGFQSEPPLEWTIGLEQKAKAVGIKAAPGIPESLVPAGWELEMIALGSDLKEAVLWSPALATSSRRATVINHGDIASLVPVPGETVPVRDAVPGDWLLDVNPAVTNAGLVEDLAREIGAMRIDPEIGFLVHDQEILHPMVTGWNVLEVLPWHEKRLRQALTVLDAGPVDIRRRGLAGDVPSITKRLRGKGDRRVIIAMTRMSNRPTAIICSLE